MSLYYQIKKNVVEPKREIEFKDFKIRNRYLVKHILFLEHKSFQSQQGEHLPKLRLPSLPHSDSNQQCLSKSPKNIPQRSVIEYPYLQLLSQQSQDLKEFIIQQRPVDKPFQKKKVNTVFQTDDLSFEYRKPQTLRKYSLQFQDDKKQYTLRYIQIQFQSKKQINLIFFICSYFIFVRIFSLSLLFIKKTY
ncbi:unnamed protein product (macronuclear) [Paramecium tetraurelia]|uniref:Transmembrane protein n=1 Tax=Paramecium tetraurelia TaxID=5888 RepID=A0BB10_PARTE|nr:uncharacterized protein GSPATT00000162001 [Paramecium tetraurelia]CAK55727.1 unnamed protein product [Paramecium tetraurelia]|eukprot:XP_001423125.1 hypothetical protein (macronuclear) [Paramecium tetraurelia strain d4-2]